MQALCGLQGIFDLFNCKTPGLCKMMVKITKRTGKNVLPILHSVDMPGGIRYNPVFDS